MSKHVVLVGPEIEENLSLRYLMASLEAAGHRSTLVRYDHVSQLSAVTAAIVHAKAELIGLSMVFTQRARDFIALAKALREAGVSTHITAGGHFASFNAKALLEDVDAIDSVILHEGERRIVKLVESLAEPSSIDGIAYRTQDGSVKLQAPLEPILELDALPPPVHAPQAVRILGIPASYLVSSRGCYASCAYCCIHAWHKSAPGPRLRMRSVESVADEMQSLHRRQGTRIFFFQDDNFFPRNRPLERLEALEGAIRQRIDGPIAIGVKARPEDITPQSRERLASLGVYRVFMGVDSFDDQGLRFLDRQVSAAQLISAVDLLRERDMLSSYNLQLFYPDVQLDELRHNLDAVRQRLEVPMNFTRTAIYSGTKLEKRLAAQGRLRGNYLGLSYTLADPQMETLFHLLAKPFHHRNFNPRGLHRLADHLDNDSRLLDFFHPNSRSDRLRDEVRGFVAEVNSDTLQHLEFAMLALGDAQHVELAEQTLSARIAARDALLEAKAKRLRARLRIEEQARKPSKLGHSVAAAAAALLLSAPLAACDDDDDDEPEFETHYDPAFDWEEDVKDGSDLEPEMHGDPAPDWEELPEIHGDPAPDW
ncbi:MAG: cobalamin-dependent protein, partial [Myxococcota bacterium]|nr:cobalamin-dependent protein [Myxococcota bacterium]